jgi:hypothetical protein
MFAGPRPVLDREGKGETPFVALKSEMQIRAPLSRVRIRLREMVVQAHRKAELPYRGRYKKISETAPS